MTIFADLLLIKEYIHWLKGPPQDNLGERESLLKFLGQLQKHLEADGEITLCSTSEGPY